MSEGADSTRVTMVCGACGSDLVTRDAFAEWCVDRQAWVLGPLFDVTLCHRCDRRTQLAARPVAD